PRSRSRPSSRRRRRPPRRPGRRCLPPFPPPPRPRRRRRRLGTPLSLARAPPLPRRRPCPRRLRRPGRPPPSRPRPPPAPRPAPPPDAQASPILLVDDEDEVRRILAERFAHGGYNVVEAEDPDAAVKKAGRLGRASIPFLLVADLGMPTSGGTSFQGGFEVVK